MIVGASFNDGGGSNAGRAYVYYGGPSADAVADLTLTGEVANDQFGFSVSGAGDVNGDGYADVIVGASFNDAGGSNAGRAYVYYGGPSADAVADLTLTGESAGDRLGFSVSGAGDVDGDGFADVVVGASFNDAGGSNAGRAYVYYGGPLADAVADLTLTGEAAGDRLGVSVSGAGDVDGDGYADVIVGANQNDAGGSNAGRAYVYYGGPSADAVADLTLTGEAAGDRLGVSVSGAGDVDGDGYADVIVGANQNDSGGSNAGRAYVYYGGPSADAVADLTLTGETADDRFGDPVSGAGDLNGDGFADVVVGAWRNDVGGSDAGRAYIYFGGPSPNTVADIILTGEAAGYFFGRSVSSAGDLDGDGLPDLIVGAESANTANGTNSGAVYVFSNAMTGEGILQWRASGEASGDLLGRSVSGAGDVNGDGHADVILGAPENDAGAFEAGRAYVYFGGPSADLIPDLTLTGQATEDSFGATVSGAGDVNGDGFADVIVGAYQAPGGLGSGRAYVYYGGPSADAVADLTLSGETDFDDFGRTVSGAGDVNGDGYADMIVGAPFNDAGGSQAGRAYVYYGGPSVDSVADLTLTGEAIEDFFGFSVSGAGDVNGDGYADVIVGAYQNDAGGSDAGRAYVYFGGPSADTVADLTLTGETADDRFGESVSGAGDLNGDGFADVVVGAWRNDVGGSDAGRAYIYYGGPSADATPDLTLTGDATTDRFGRSVSDAGDVNGDGHADVIVGASHNDAGGSDTGRAYVYYGGPSADAVADLTLTGEAANDQFGFSVSGAGDVNGDGRSDVIVGAERNDAGGSDSGAAYLYQNTAPGPSPSFYSLKDVPGDEGGLMELKWTRSGFEGTTSTTISRYRVERSEPAGASGYAWETLTTFTANGNVRYSFGAETYSDSLGTNLGTACFRISAEGSLGEQWHSLVRCGASVDNVAPPPPLAFTLGESADGDVLLDWDAIVGTPDLLGYNVYRSADDACDVADTFLATAEGASTTTYEDNATPFGPDLHYCLTAVDVHANESPFALAANSVDGLPTEHALHMAYPNPFNPQTTLTYDVATAGKVGVVVYDAVGREVMRLVDNEVEPGRYHVTLDARSLASGIYFVRMTTIGFAQTQRVTLLK